MSPIDAGGVKALNQCWLCAWMRGSKFQRSRGAGRPTESGGVWEHWKLLTISHTLCHSSCMLFARRHGWSALESVVDDRVRYRHSGTIFANVSREVRGSRELCLCRGMHTWVKYCRFSPGSGGISVSKFHLLKRRQSLWKERGTWWRTRPSFYILVTLGNTCHSFNGTSTATPFKVSEIVHVLEQCALVATKFCGGIAIE